MEKDAGRFNAGITRRSRSSSVTLAMVPITSEALQSSHLLTPSWQRSSHGFISNSEISHWPTAHRRSCLWRKLGKEGKRIRPIGRAPFCHLCVVSVSLACPQRQVENSTSVPATRPTQPPSFSVKWLFTWAHNTLMAMLQSKELWTPKFLFCHWFEGTVLPNCAKFISW